MYKKSPVIPLSDCTGIEAADTTKSMLPGVKSESLLGEHGELKIEHNGEQYSLRRTRQGKLILTK